MKSAIFWTLAGLAALIGVFGLTQLSTGKSASENSILAFQTVKRDIASGAKFYDVRTPEEYAGGHFEDSVLWALQEIEAGKLVNADKNSKIYLHCRSGNRSSQAKALLEKAGYTNVVDLGGLSDVESMGGQLTS